MKNIRVFALAALAVVCLFPLLLIADDAPAKPEVPPQEANGLKLEISVANDPLYPGDDLMVDVRLTNTQKEGDIQIIDMPMQWISFHFVAIGPDGQQITWPEPKVMIKRPQAPTATLPPGGFYGRKISLDASQMRKPGKYAISVRYSNGDALKDLKFNCWTGDLQSNTAFFEVPDFSKVPAVDGIQMLVKMKPQYREDEPVTIEVRLYNAGDKDKDVYVLDDGFLMFSHAVPMVTNFDGRKILPKLPEGREVVLPAKNKLAPGGTFLHEYNLNDLVSPPVGKYALELHCALPDIGQMTSNKVSFEILPAEKSKEPEAPVKDGMQMTIKMAKEKYEGNEPIKFTVSLKNVSDKEKAVYVFDNAKVFLSYYSDGVLKNAEGKTMGWRGILFEIAPQVTKAPVGLRQAHTAEYDLREACGTLPAGKYTLQLHSKIPDLGEMTSNEVSFEILPAEPIKDGVEMSIKMAKEKYAEYEPVTFTVSLKNVSDKEKKINKLPRNLLTAYSDGQVTNEKGKVVGWRVTTDEALPAEPVTLAPGATTTMECDLHDACFLPAGKYTFQLHTAIPSLGNMISNEVSFEIIPAEKPKPEVPPSMP